MFIEILFIMAEKRVKPQTFIGTFFFIFFRNFYRNKRTEISDSYSDIDKTPTHTLCKKAAEQKKCVLRHFSM